MLGCFFSSAFLSKNVVHGCSGHRSFRKPLCFFVSGSEKRGDIIIARSLHYEILSRRYKHFKGQWFHCSVFSQTFVNNKRTTVIFLSSSSSLDGTIKTSFFSRRHLHAGIRNRSLSCFDRTLVLQPKDPPMRAIRLWWMSRKCQQLPHKVRLWIPVSS